MQTLAQAIKSTKTMEACQVVKNEAGEEMLLSFQNKVDGRFFCCDVKFNQIAIECLVHLRNMRLDWYFWQHSLEPKSGIWHELIQFPQS